MAGVRRPASRFIRRGQQRTPTTVLFSSCTVLFRTTTHPGASRPLRVSAVTDAVENTPLCLHRRKRLNCSSVLPLLDRHCLSPFHHLYFIQVSKYLYIKLNGYSYSPITVHLFVFLFYLFYETMIRLQECCANNFLRIM